MQKTFLELRKKIIEKEFSRMNDMQKKAVFTTEGPLLILAGAGSGKTTVLVSRIANIVKYGDAYTSSNIIRQINESDIQMLKDYYEDKIPCNMEIAELLSHYKAQPWQILAITFTNKAATELKERLALYLGEEQSRDIWAGTFHSICTRILRRYGDRIGYTSHFTIYDTDDSKRIIKECQRLLNIDDKLLPHKTILNKISRLKDALVTPAEYIAETEKVANAQDKKYAECYKLYQQLLLSADAMDFDDIIVNTVKLLKTDSEVREKYQNQFRYVHVDEYQDTNHAQYELTRLLAGGYNNICVVGDDDQSIYKFRGATIENILDFESNYKNATVIRLEQNYRSTGNILNAANAVIKNNKERKGKNLWTASGDGEKITFFTAENEMDEGTYIADEISTGVSNGKKFSDFAVLYRTNAQSNSIERAFVRMGVPYKVVGGKRFYERKEIRDALAYLCLINNPSDTVKLKRIINEPKRGIGDTTVNKASEIAASLGVSLFEIIATADQYDILKRSSSKLLAFAAMINEIRAFALEAPMDQVFDVLMEKTGYADSLKLDPVTYEERLSNLHELKSNMKRYLEENEDGDLQGFLEEVALLSDIDAYNEQSDVCVLMTLHSAKGLEFPIVFMAGMEENLFPGNKVMYDLSEIEEERRLAYVGITRAKEKLYLTCASTRMLYGTTSRSPVSRFVTEIPDEYFEEQPIKTSVYAPSKSSYGTSSYTSYAQKQEARARARGASFKRPSYASATGKASSTNASVSYSIGDTVSHKAFGTGVVLNVTPMGNDSLIEIAFEKAGTKKLMANFAKLTKEN